MRTFNEWAVPISLGMITGHLLGHLFIYFYY